MSLRNRKKSLTILVHLPPTPNDFRFFIYFIKEFGLQHNNIKTIFYLS